MQYLKEEEKLILAMLDKFKTDLNKLKVEELGLRTAIDHQQRADPKKGPSPQSGDTSSQDSGTSKLDARLSGFSMSDEIVCVEDLDLRVPDNLQLGTEMSPPNYLGEEEEEEDEEKEGMK